MRPAGGSWGDFFFSFWGIIGGKIIRGMQGGEEERGKKGEVSFLFALFCFRNVTVTSL